MQPIIKMSLILHSRMKPTFREFVDPVFFHLSDMVPTCCAMKVTSDTRSQTGCALRPVTWFLHSSLLMPEDLFSGLYSWAPIQVRAFLSLKSSSMLHLMKRVPRPQESLFLHWKTEYCWLCSSESKYQVVFRDWIISHLEFSHEFRKV